MSVTLDNSTLFDEQGFEIETGSLSRAHIDRAIPGLDGMLSIDLGERTREIRQKGVLRASSRAAMQVRIDSIAAFMDGRTHTLRAAGGREYRNVRMDSLRQIDERAGGQGIIVQYEIIYTQLGA
ncbi:MAG: hypothetical protein JW955_17920 [Sedimentisphaerales bacterium]|nr:hypothetical protein [Sedimentisphaerales bacterium]